MADPFVAEIKIFAGNFAPRNYAFCDGTLLPIAQNTALFSLIGTIYGGDGRTTTALPNLKGKVPMGWGRGPGLSDRRIGEKGGVATVNLNNSTMPNHSHTLNSTTEDTDEEGETTAKDNLTGKMGGADGIYAPSTGAKVNMSSDPQALTDTGGNQPHDNQMAVQVLNYIIALTGSYPSRS